MTKAQLKAMEDAIHEEAEDMAERMKLASQADKPTYASGLLILIALRNAMREAIKVTTE